MSEAYKSARALEMAVKEAAKESPLDTGRASSWVKYLVDIAIYDTKCKIDGGKLQKTIHRELSARKLEGVRAFVVPNEWGDVQARQYAKLCMQTGLPESFRSLENAGILASDLLNPAIDAAVDGRSWDCSNLNWCT